jgi:hypothetical protein
MREHDVAALYAVELEAARRELAASLARPGSPVRVPIQACLAAIDAELAGRAAARPGLRGSPRARPSAAGTRVEEGRPGIQVPGCPLAWGRCTSVDHQSPPRASPTRTGTCRPASAT